MRREGQPAPSSPDAGMALIVVLGFVAVLAVIAVSLIITMRVERLATNSFAETVRARQLINVALARAMNDIDAEMVGRDALYPADLYTINAGASAITNPFATFESRLYVPQALTSALPSSVRLADVTVGTSVVGRVGYLAVDTSGFVDANIAGTRPRRRGVEGGEVQLSTIGDIRNLANFVALRSNEWRRFESIAELFYLGRSSGTLFTNSPLGDFAVYSQFGPDFNTNGAPKVFLGGDTNALLSRRADIVAALRACNVPNPENVFTNLLDYVDTDSVPRDLDSFTTEAVPMINEVIFSNAVARQVSGSDTITIHRLYMTVETWFPFGDRSFPAANLVVDGSPIVNVIATTPPELAIDPLADLLTPAPRTITNHAPHTFRLTTFVWEKRTNAPITQPSVVIRVQMNGRLAVEQGGNRLDLARLPNSNIDLRAPIPPNPGVTRIASLSVVDPRLNYVPAQWASQVAQGDPPPGGIVTPGAINQNASGGEGVSSMYVRDFPLDLSKVGVGVGTVGELGFLSVGSPWRTIALYNTPGVNLHPVLDYFTVNTSAVRRSLVNINSPNLDALSAAVANTPIDAYPGGPGPTVTVAAARTFASNIVNRLNNPADRFERNRALSVLGEFDAGLIAALNGALPSPALTNDALRESIIRNSAGLFSYRQNLFNVYLFAQSLTPGGMAGAEARAIATIWRDPEFEDPANQTNKMFVRFFRWL